MNPPTVEWIRLRALVHHFKVDSLTTGYESIRHRFPVVINLEDGLELLEETGWLRLVLD